MCGIVGFIGTEQAAPILLEGLSRLEYRGYDSAGLAVYDQEKGLQVVKAKGRLQVLYDLTDGGALVPGVMGVGHTRWATHGAPNDVNSHPQVGQSGRIAVVHNGIIENYAKLKEFLESKGVTFASETDTEVVAQLLEYYYDGDLLDAVSKVLHRIEGAYALGIVCADEPDKLVAVRKDSPLVLGYGEGFNLLASDVTAVIKHTREVCYLDDGEVAVLTPGSVQVYNSLLRPVEKERSHVDWEISAAEKGGYEHFMFKEIMEQPKALRDTIFPRLRGDRVVLDDLTITREELERMDRLYIIACGSSYHVGVAAKYILERLLRIPVEVTLASEFRYCNEFLVDSDTLDKDAALEFLSTMGDCELCVGEVPKFKVHVHSDHPDQVLKYFLDHGQISEVFIHNMQIQSAERTEKLAAEEQAERKPLGFVAVAAGSGQAEILKSLGVDVIVSGGQTMNPSTKDLLDAAGSVNADAVIILPNNSNIIMAANSAAELSETPCAVVPTKSVPQAFSALFAVDVDASLETNVEEMTEAAQAVKTGEVTWATRDSKDAEGNPIAEGDVIGIADGSIEAVDDSIDGAVLTLLGKMEAEDADTCTILAGEGYSDEDLEALVAKIEEAYD